MCLLIYIWMHLLINPLNSIKTFVSCEKRPGKGQISWIVSEDSEAPEYEMLFCALLGYVRLILIWETSAGSKGLHRRYTMYILLCVRVWCSSSSRSIHLSTHHIHSSHFELEACTPLGLIICLRLHLLYTCTYTQSGESNKVQSSLSDGRCMKIALCSRSRKIC